MAQEKPFSPLQPLVKLALPVFGAGYAVLLCFQAGFPIDPAEMMQLALAAALVGVNAWKADAWPSGKRQPDDYRIASLLFYWALWGAGLLLSRVFDPVQGINAAVTFGLGMGITNGVLARPRDGQPVIDESRLPRILLLLLSAFAALIGTLIWTKDVVLAVLLGNAVLFLLPDPGSRVESDGWRRLRQAVFITLLLAAGASTARI
ncbi:hypothetical protein [Leisingera sp. ANG-M1]|uniref:hypothetical protein n=1 Tax=Leisingera sp. ANG-M1 TaxID=1577895 RepID=UPI000B02BEAB|nr:hypothetical protein [Leisingera sp. ANG-M1]